MKATALKDLVDYLNNATGPGKKYQVGPGIVWSVVIPRQDAAKDLKGTLADPRIRSFVGIVIPGGSTNIGTARHPYGPDQPRGGALRQMSVSLSIFARSMKQYAYDGVILEIEDIIQELVGDFSNKDSEGVSAASVQELNISMLEPDFVVLEFMITLKYTTMSREGWLQEPKIVLPGTGADVLIPGQTLTPTGDSTVWTLPDGREITLNPDGTITLPDGTIIKPNADGTWTLPSQPITIPIIDGKAALPNGWIIIFNPDGTITLLPANIVIQPNADGTWTLPDGTVVRRNPITVTLPDGTVIPVNPDGTLTLPPITITRNEDGTYTLPGGDKITINADGTITLPDGTVIHKNADGSYTLPGGDKIYITQLDGGKEIQVIYVLSPNPDGTFTLPDGTIVKPSPPTITIYPPAITIVLDNHGDPTVGEKQSALLSFILNVQKVAPTP